MAENQDHLKNIKNIGEANKLLQEQINMSIALKDLEKARALNEEMIANNILLQNERNQLNNELHTGNLKLTKEEKKELDNIEKSQKNINSQLQSEGNWRRKIVDFVKLQNNHLKIGWQFLQQSDKTIKSTILSLGMSGAKAEMMRSSFESSAVYVAKLGGTLEDIQGVMQGYADETGRARALSAEMVKDVVAIGKGTGLGIEQATRLSAQFEMMGYNAQSTMDYVQGVVDTSERMGVNTTKVLKNISDNFKRLNTYTFQQGVKGIAQMAMYAEKFHMDINQALNAADVSRTLEGAIDLTSQLQIMGGEFAKTDPFEMLFLSRNDPAKFTEKIADMTKGIVSFRKMADGSFEKFISPADRDRLASVAKSLGMESSELTKIAERQSEIQRIRQQMQGMGLSPEQKELIEGAAVFNTKTGKFEAMVAGQMRDVTKLTQTQAEGFVKERKTLEQRAKESQSFDEAFQATINELKSALLPILQGVNKVLTYVRPIVESFTRLFTEGKGAWLKTAGLLIVGATAWKVASSAFNKAIDKFVERGVGGMFGGGGAKTTSTVSTQSTTTSKTSGVASKTGSAGGGGKAFGKGAGIGAAALGIGAGVGLAAVGISKLADSMSKLSPEQADSLKSIAMTLAITFPAAAIGIALVGQTAQAGALGLMALGAAFALVGTGVYLAATGIGNMAEGLTKLVTAGKGAGDDMLKLSAGIGALSLSMLGFTAGAFGLAVFAGLMHTIAKNAPAITAVGDAFKQINTVMSGSKEDFMAVENAVASISNMNTKGGGMFKELSNLIKNGIKVEFADKQVALVNNITLDIDGNKFMEKTYNVNAAIQKHEAIRQGKGGNS
jgi:hypothetical protein